MGWIRLAIFGLIALTVVYFLVSVYSRSVRREKLEKRYDAGITFDHGEEADRDNYIANGMAAYDKGLKKRLIWLVYIMPIAVFAVTVYLVNWD